MRRSPFTTLPANTMVTGPIEVLVEALFGDRQHDAHMQAWRWHTYTSRYDETAVMEALRRALHEPA